MPPVSSRTTVKSTPAQTLSLRGDPLISDGAAKEQGRKFPNVLRDFRSVKSPCSGRTRPVPYFC